MTARPLPNDDEGTWTSFLDREDDSPPAWLDLALSLCLLVFGVAASWLTWELAYRIGLKLAGMDR